ncbi:MAG TPA: response regulator transcription factor [Acidobacteriaceae bacterium]|jgi:DNA-binding response OmpR family regulator|nr:response regulator transcription factor [Acidobacteriaceae bacterium]
MRLLVIEDERRLAENIAAAFKEGPGYAVDLAYDGEVGAYLGETSEYDLIVLDLMLPKIDGVAVLKRLRERGQRTPVMVLTAVTTKESVVELLNSGADDYLGKPFDLGELIARAKALIRRGKGVSHPILFVGDLAVDTIEKTVSRDGLELELSPTEYRILEYMSHRPRSVISKQTLLEHLYNYNWEHHSNVIEAHVSNLRRKLNRPSPAGQPSVHFLETLRGRGYRLLASTADSSFLSPK